MENVRTESRIDEAVASFDLSGDGVIIAILDRGIDWEHPDFRNDDGTTRINWLLDLTNYQGCDPNAPGVAEYSEAEINAALDGSGPNIDSRDAVGHGTVTAGIAAGNGNAFGDGKYRGVAPGADLIIAKVVSEGAPAHGDEAAEEDFVSCFDLAVDWVDAKAAELGKPVVAVANYGVQYGPLDGTSGDSQKIDQVFGLDTPGRIWVAPAGNEGGVDNHAGGTYETSADTVVPFSAPLRANQRLTAWVLAREL